MVFNTYSPQSTGNQGQKQIVSLGPGLHPAVCGNHDLMESANLLDRGLFLFLFLREGEAEDEDEEDRKDDFLRVPFPQTIFLISLGTEPSGEDAATSLTDDEGEPCPSGMYMKSAEL
ncbi:UNVERIFIED_CONTAM: hypothetical protein FKN15_031287 [Acipenser sinensis]